MVVLSLRRLHLKQSGRQKLKDARFSGGDLPRSEQKRFDVLLEDAKKNHVLMRPRSSVVGVDVMGLEVRICSDCERIHRIEKDSYIRCVCGCVVKSKSFRGVVN